VTKTIVVPLDETELAERALPVAASLAAAAGAELELLVVDAAGPRSLEEETYLTSMREQLPVELQVRQVAVHRDAPVAELVVTEAVGRPEPVIVMATHGRTAIGELVLGSVADAVIRRSPVPVVLVGPRCSPAPIAGDGPILVALDGSPGDAGVIETAARFGVELGGPVVAVHVRVPVAVDGGVVLEGGDEVAVHAAEQLRALGVPAAELTVEALYPAEELVRTASHRGARAIVVGTHRPSRLERAVLGSTAMAVVRRSTCPAVVVGAPIVEE
jgi:nucleotide-binding universal stress UspA family protein